MESGKSEVNNLKKEINSLAKRLQEVNQEKAQKIKDRGSVRNEIRTLLDSLKNLKTSSTGNFKENLEKLRNQRDKCNDEVKKLSSELKELKNKQLKLEKKSKISLDEPLKIKEKIDQLEKKVETEVVSFEKEKKIMDEIRKLKDIFKKSAEFFHINQQIDLVSKSMHEVREAANSFHNSFISLVKSGRERSRQYKEIFRKLDFLRQNEEIKKNEVLDAKKNIDTVNNELNTKLIAIGKTKINIPKTNKQLENERIIEEKTKIVEEKLKNKEKLTTEDLIVYQNKLNKENKDE
ncbi:hypothetical protein HYX16_00445 [Candidatus Woesearchaeota archaeon]|nr:hypothetical protein [Candidatus Woesearchaeota archaeon]